MALRISSLAGFTGRQTSEEGGGGATAPTFRSAGTIAATTTASITPGLPSGTAENDILFCHLQIGGNQGTTGFPTVSGWTLINSNTYSVLSRALYWRRAGSGETATTFDLVTNDSSKAYAGVVTAWQDCITSGTPYTDQAYGIQNPTTTTPLTLDLTPTTDDGRLVFFHGVEDNTPWSVSPPPSGWTLEDDQTTTVSDDLRIFCISYDTATEDNSTQIDEVTAGTLNATEWCHRNGLVLVPN